MESSVDLNLLVALDALLAECSVNAAAARLHSSPPATSRTLARLRRVFGDPLLVRAGRVMVPTPRALALQPQVRQLIGSAEAVFATPGPIDTATLNRVFCVQASDIVVSSIGTSLYRRIHRQAPLVSLRFAGEGYEDAPSLRDGGIDLVVGQVRREHPETHIELLLDDHLVGVARPGHPILESPITAVTFAAAEHVVFSRRGIRHGPVDEQLAQEGLTRHVSACVANSTSALHLVRSTDLLGIVGAHICDNLVAALGLRTFEIPLDLPPLRLSLAWHPRHDADPAHGWLRQQVHDALRDTLDQP